jgi:hypothetical protein
MIVTTENGKKLEVANKSLNSGGQGGVYEILSPGYDSHIVKIYHDKNKAKALEKKLQYMVQFNPLTKAPLIIRKSLAWPEATVYQNNQFVGYVMPKITNAIELTELTTPKSPHHRNGLEWKKFDISNLDGFRTRLVISYNISKAVELLHKSGMYTLVDLKPDNIMVDKDGIITIIDLDSIQVTDAKGTLLFYADVFTEEYTPPEFYNQKIVPKLSKIEKSWDVFSFAVICYKILFAIHPYQASHEKYNTISDLIKNGYFVHGNKQKSLGVIPYIHKSFHKLPRSVSELFIRTFENGNNILITRPNLSEWVSSFSSLLFSQTVINNITLYPNIYTSSNHKISKVNFPASIQIHKSYHENDVEISWFTTNTVTCELNDQKLGLKGSMIVSLENKKYTFLLTGQDGSKVSKRIYIRVPAPKIINFSIVDISKGYGLLQWNVSNASNVLLNNITVPKKGTKKINLYLPDYTLQAINKTGISTKKILKNPIWVGDKKFQIIQSENKVNQKESILSTSTQIQFSEQIRNKQFAINSKF